MDPDAARPDIHYATTPDGWSLALYRYAATRPGAPAVLLSSGYACNRHFIDFDDRYSLARYLARSGFDAWVVELRGRGRSRPPPGRHRRVHRWTFDELAQLDVPTALEFVLREIGHRRLCWIGHSMGGMVIYAYLGLAQNGLRPAAAVTLATPVRFAQKATGLTQSIGSLLLSLPFPNRVPQRIPLGILWHVVGRTRALEVGMNPENIDPRVVRRALRRSLSDGSRRKLQQLADWARTGRFTSLDGGIDYRENLRKVTTPTLILCGASDPLAPPECSEPAYELLAAARKRFVVVGRASGFSMDYGHVDLILGQRAPEEVFPLVASWVGETLSMEGR